MMTLINQQITHIRYGEGMVISHENDKMHVRFSANDETKCFIYPDSFEKFLKLKDPAMEKIIKKELDDRHKQILAQEALKQKEYAESVQKIALDKLMLAAEKKKAPKKKKTATF